MPIYAYECRKCGDHEEYIQKLNDPPMTRCEHCGGRLEKLVTAAAFHLKGGGWYADGYASSKSGEDKGGADKSGADKGGTADASVPASAGEPAAATGGKTAASDAVKEGKPKRTRAAKATASTD